MRKIQTDLIKEIQEKTDLYYESDVIEFCKDYKYKYKDVKECLNKLILNGEILELHYCQYTEKLTKEPTSSSSVVYCVKI